MMIADLPPRQPSDGYQILDDVPGAGELPAGSSSDQHSDHRHQHQQQQQHQPGASSTSSSDDSSSEFGNVARIFRSVRTRRIRRS